MDNIISSSTNYAQRVSGGVKMIKLGTATTGTTLDVSTYNGFENFNVETNFMIKFTGPTTKSTGFSHGGAANGAFRGTLYTYTELDAVYDNTTGILTLNKCNSVAKVDLTTFGSGGTISPWGRSYTLSNPINAEVYLIY